VFFGVRSNDLNGDLCFAVTRIPQASKKMMNPSDFVSSIARGRQNVPEFAGVAGLEVSDFAIASDDEWMSP